MLRELKQRISGSWNLVRIIRTALGVMVLVQAYDSRDILLAALGGIILFHGIFNYGCCGSGGCDINHTKKEKGHSLLPEDERTLQ